jgi:hypothetical protein
MSDGMTLIVRSPHSGQDRYYWYNTSEVKALAQPKPRHNRVVRTSLAALATVGLAWAAYAAYELSRPVLTKSSWISVSYSGAITGQIYCKMDTTEGVMFTPDESSAKHRVVGMDIYRADSYEIVVPPGSTVYREAQVTIKTSFKEGPTVTATLANIRQHNGFTGSQPTADYYARIINACAVFVYTANQVGLRPGELNTLPTKSQNGWATLEGLWDLPEPPYDKKGIMKQMLGF